MAKYLYPTSMPYDDLSFIDQSQYTETTPVEAIDTIPSGPIAFIPFVSPRGYGEDNKLMYMDSTLLAKYGKPNLKKYGLSLYLAKRFVEGGGTVLGMRMMPASADYAHCNVYAKVEESVTIPTVEELAGRYPNQKTIRKVLWSLDKTFDCFLYDNGKIVDANKNEIKYVTINDTTVTGVDGAVYNIESDTYAVVEKVQSENSDRNTYNLYIVDRDFSEGNTLRSNIPNYTVSESSLKLVSYQGIAEDKDLAENEYKVFTVRAQAKGEFAKSFQFKLTADTTQNAVDPTHFFYKFSSSENGGKLDGDMTFTFDDDYVYGDDCLGVADVFEKYAKNITMEKFIDGGEHDFDAFLKAILIDVDADPVTDPYKYDILFGSNTDSFFSVVDGEDGFILSNYRQLGGSNLNGEVDGYNVDEVNFTQFGKDTFSDPFASLFVEVYGADVSTDNGIYTDLIYDEVRYPFQYIFIPSYDDAVISAALDLIDNRHITRGYFTYPMFNTYKEARNWASEHLGDSKAKTWKTSDYCEYWQIKDPYTKKNTMMPSTYFNAYHMPYHWMHSKGAPYAGTRNFNWSGGKVGTMVPCSVNPNEYIENHNIGLNTMLEDGLGYASGYEQITSQQRANITSQLSENNNATILAEMARIALKMSSDARWTTLSDTEISTFITNVEESIKLELGSTYKQLTVEGERESVNGAGRNRIHCRFYVNFNDILKGVTYEFYILAN